MIEIYFGTQIAVTTGGFELWTFCTPPRTHWRTNKKADRKKMIYKGYKNICNFTNFKTVHTIENVIKNGIITIKNDKQWSK